jgi:quercetin dioxygenase-like cupin family protein
MIIQNELIEPYVIDGHATRKILGMGGTLMMVEVVFKKGGIGSVHSHDNHEQISYIAKGCFEVTVGGETKVLRTGDSFYAGYLVPHGVVALEDSVIVDVFNPVREDFLEAHNL